MITHLLRYALLTLSVATVLAAEEAPKPVHHTIREVEGWTIRVDDRLLAAHDEALGIRALALLKSRLAEIKMVMQPDKVARLQQVTIQLDLTHGSLTSMQYHPAADWLTEHGFSADLAKCVHIPVASHFTDPNHQHIQPWSLLHELAHSYHNQVLNFENPEIKAVWERYKQSGHGESVLYVKGQHRKHYALTNQMEFFAEMTECYFGVNDFFPFVNGELQEAEPAIYELMTKIWGPLVVK